jgi:V8-like Glu-specific endopeptidase
MKGLLLWGVLGLGLFTRSGVAGPLPPLYFAMNMPSHAAPLALAAEPDYAQAKLSTIRIETPNLVCSATAIGPHQVLTAEHCTAKGLDGWRMNTRNVVITHVELDGNDHVILTTDLFFEHTAKFGARPKQGDVVFSHGNPALTSDILLVGRVAGWVDNYEDYKDVMLLDRNDWYGCSGAAVFNTKGEIVGVVNALYPWPNKGWRLSAVFKLDFTPWQIEGRDPTEAESYAQFARDLLELQRHIRSISLH